VERKKTFGTGPGASQNMSRSPNRRGKIFAKDSTTSFLGGGTGRGTENFGGEKSNQREKGKETWKPEMKGTKSIKKKHKPPSSKKKRREG